MNKTGMYVGTCLLTLLTIWILNSTGSCDILYKTAELEVPRWNYGLMEYM